MHRHFPTVLSGVEGHVAGQELDLHGEPRPAARQPAHDDVAALGRRVNPVEEQVHGALAWTLLAAAAAFTEERVVTVLVIACPHALGLAVPRVVAISTTIGAHNGLLVRDRRGLEEARHLRAIVFDKTSTLTLGAHRMVAMRTTDGMTEDDALRLAGALERDAAHPVARAIVKSAAERGIALPRASELQAIPGHGVQATVDGRGLAEGVPDLLARLGVEPPTTLRDFAHEAAPRARG